ncbi:flavin-containing monooxygenase [Alterisphingorhabdus coralli]|uniref:NAD(P)/FAD-dependent oxidoreductase n=1 Tax=Alterisphingorhabdus coralli TaxID=3071408 RepID=A0AA97F6K6_9SPHN|nr:NAD(P)/FAD-dependent oxidoreductase [Parasphingorhabdus sp. SCSIO 66989]WOE74893.1 NAD(P)/FAD-dependent oxidoreductase [Parasphingorhabdus sp. SCSIO 66989]
MAQQAELQEQVADNHVDVLIVGAGISGIGSAYHLQQQCPGKSYAILEMKDSFGGTWETHKYPGVRSDSDLYTFGYRFKPWVGAPIASGEEILKYLGEVIEENGIDQHIHYGHRITACKWSSADNLWTIEATRSDGTDTVFTANFLWMCQGYYDHENPYIPDWEGLSDYQGDFIHAQQWDPDYDYAGKRIVVIGSGATAATVIPAFAEKAQHVTMLQRSPTYFFCSENKNELADRLREVGVDEPTVHRCVRAQVMFDQDVLTRRAKEEPDVVFEELKALIREFTGKPDFEFEPHFTPRYRPWQQRLAFCPEGDVFKAAVDGRLTVVTDTIDRFTEKGVRTSSGEELEADLIVATTGFQLSVMGNIPFEVDGEAVDWHETLTYRGMMFTDIPNLAWVMGYFRASWTLRVDMLGDFVCRLLNHMDAKGVQRVNVAPRAEDADMQLLDWMDEDDFNPGYMQRGMHLMPRRGAKHEWMHNQDYWAEKDEIPYIDLDGSEFLYDGKRASSAAEPEVAAAE